MAERNPKDPRTSGMYPKGVDGGVGTLRFNTPNAVPGYADSDFRRAMLEALSANDAQSGVNPYGSPMEAREGRMVSGLAELGRLTAGANKDEAAMASREERDVDSRKELARTRKGTSKKSEKGSLLDDEDFTRAMQVFGLDLAQGRGGGIIGAMRDVGAAGEKTLADSDARKAKAADAAAAERNYRLTERGVVADEITAMSNAGGTMTELNQWAAEQARQSFGDDPGEAIRLLGGQETYDKILDQRRRYYLQAAMSGTPMEEIGPPRQAKAGYKRDSMGRLVPTTP